MKDNINHIAPKQLTIKEYAETYSQDPKKLEETNFSSSFKLDKLLYLLEEEVLPRINELEKTIGSIQDKLSDKFLDWLSEPFEHEYEDEDNNEE